MQVIVYLCQYEGKDALSTEAQLEQIRMYAARHHLELIEIIKDTQHVADLKKNSGLKRALNKCQESPELGFIVARLDCLTQSLRMLRALVGGSLRRITLFSVEEELDTRTRAGRSVLSVLESISQWESDIKQIEQQAKPIRPKPAADVKWWDVYGKFEGRLFRPEPPSIDVDSSQS